MVLLESEVEQPAQVEGGGAVVEPSVVLGDAAVAQLAAASGHEPRAGPFDHRSVLAVVVLPLPVLGALAVLTLQRVVFVQVQRPAVLGSGALGDQWAGADGRAKVTDCIAVIGRVAVSASAGPT